MDKIEETIKAIAVKHGIAVGRDDPIMILQTINERLMQESSKAQKEILNNFKEELEVSALRWSEEAKNTAKMTINAALKASKEMMMNSLKEDGERTAKKIRLNFQGIINEMQENISKEYNRVSILILVSAFMVLVSSSFSLWIMLKLP